MAEKWDQVEVRDLAVGDTIENPGNGAGERVTHHVIKSRSFVEFAHTGDSVPREVPADRKYWRLRRGAR